MATDSSQQPSEEIRNYVMAPPLPVDPGTAEPITRQVRIVPLGHHQKKNHHGDEILEIELDTDERHLFDTLQQVAMALEQGTVAGQTAPKQVQVRVAGGWVRDKILGLQTHDVDIALDTCTGVEFATVLKHHVEVQQKQQQQQNNRSSPLSQQKVCGRIGVIAANPAQSKHLETATMKIFGIEVDFSNLRHETYAEDSRIPETVMGTALEDAYRRDFTMNSLYYNLHTQSIEDWTRRGLQDLLDSKIVQTPLEAYQTFHDDPLRVLRAIRFAVRYGMELSQDLMQACIHPQIHMELHRKVSRERVGKELEGMLSGKHADPMKAMDLICTLKLAGSVFCLPGPEVPLLGTISQAHLEEVPYQAINEDQLAHLREHAWEEARECVKALPSVLQALKIQANGKVVDSFGDAQSPMNPRLVYLAIIMLPYKHLLYVIKNKQRNVVDFMLREGIKFNNKDVAAMTALTEGLDDMSQLLQRTPETSSTMRLQAGMLLRATKDMWVTTLVAATVALIRKKHKSCTDWCQRAKEWYDTIVNEMNLDGCWSAKPLMNGKDLIQFLGLDKGPVVGIYSQDQIQWMLMNPRGTLNQLKEFLRGVQKEREFEENQAAQHIS
jgi:tRNA nucleotidyltransferase (CCA-adding enzyme)